MDPISQDNPLEDANLPETPAAPPPPPEVKIRTMHSDLESITKNGGGLPRFENVKVEGLARGSGGEEVEKKKNTVMMAFTILAVVILIALAGYIAYTRYLK